MEEAIEVENVGPKEYASRRTRAEREIEKPLECGGFAPSPELVSFVDFSGSGEEDSTEYSKGDESHGEGVDGGDWAEKERKAVAEEEEEEMEEDREEDVITSEPFTQPKLIKLFLILYSPGGNTFSFYW